jgi:predicted AlkP superfamily phosphohydrolase/phosphomutase
MHESGIESLTLVLTNRPHSGSWVLNWHTIATFAASVIVIDCRTESPLFRSLQKQLPDGNFRLLYIDPDQTPSQWTEKLRSSLKGAAPWLLLLDTGRNLDISAQFRLPKSLKPHRVLHRSSDGEFGQWVTSLIPNIPEQILIDAGRTILTNSADAGTQRVHHITVTAPLRRFQPGFPGLNNELHRETPLYPFDMANHLFSAGRYDEAVVWYTRFQKSHSGIAFNMREPLWIASYQIARCLDLSNHDWTEVQAAYLAAFDLDPNRSEPLFHLSSHLLEQGDAERAYEAATIGIEIVQPDTRYPFELSVYLVDFPRLFIEAAYSLGMDQQCIRMCNRLLSARGIPEQERKKLFSLRTRSISRFQPGYGLNIKKENHIIVLVPFRNAGKFLSRCVGSLVAQDYKNCRFILIDDGSTDSELENLDICDSRVKIVRNDFPQGVLANQLSAVERFCNDDDIVVYVDGDDTLERNDVLSVINDNFNSTRCWVLYSQYIDTNDRLGRCGPIIPGERGFQESLREIHFPMHIRAHRAGLVARYQEIDPTLSRLKDGNREFLNSVADMAIMYVLIQLSGIAHIHYVDKVLYRYNSRNPESNYAEFERQRMQSQQSDIVFSHSPLNAIDDFMHETTAVPSKRPQASNTRLLFVGLDGMTPSLIHQWADEGKLPHFSELLDRTVSRAIEFPNGFGNDAFWTSLVTGCLPDAHGNYYRNVWRAEEFTQDRFDPDTEIKQAPFWTELSEMNSEVAVIDIPESMHSGRVNGLEVTDWIVHARYQKTRYCPESLEEKWERQFGIDAVGGSSESDIPWIGERYERLMELMIPTISQKTSAAMHYLARGGWDLFAIGYGQAHSIAHQFWHIHDPNHPAHRAVWRKRYGDPLLQIYQEIDQALGSLFSCAGKDTKICLVAGLAMGRKASCNSHLDEMLWKIECSEWSEYITAKSRHDRENRRFFAVPHNNNSGAVRVNLKDRELRGIINPGDDYDKLIEKLTQHLEKIVDDDTGEPVIQEILRVAQRFSGKKTSALPDLFLTWRNKSVIRAVRSPWFDSMVLKPRGITDMRTGDHYCSAEVISNFGINGCADSSIPVENISRAITETLRN